ncbi:aspartate dehydrogenase [Geminicoccaceae bacterium 1502E]|nr:aspartate dehydrogenase [Geminicoccaceae bacterium 1502E]
MRRIGIIGFGAIGAEVASRLGQGIAGPVELVVLLRPGSSRRAAVPACVTVVDSPRQLLALRPHLVVEAAGHAALREHAVLCLEAGVPVVASSIGALADEALRARLEKAAREGGAPLLLPGGAVTGQDYLEAVRHLPDTRVTYISRKPPAAWQDQLAARGIAPEALKEPLELFAGTASEAARRYPKNLNVAATLALAGLGMEQTAVRVIVDPAACGNTHEVTVEGPAGRMTLSLVNAAAPANPKTAWVTGLSVAAAVARHFAAVRVA